MIPLFIWILCPADIVYLIKIDILGSRIKVMKKWCLRIFIWRYKGICLLYSPRMWRWSCSQLRIADRALVFSTYVEVILHLVLAPLNCDCILHVCGSDPTKSRYYFNPWSILHTCEGDPNWFSGCSYGLRYSPHMLNLLLSWNVQKNSW